MSGSGDTGEPTGFFDHLDDPAPPNPGRPALDAVMSRGRRIRARRHAIIGASSAAAVTVLVLGGLGLSRTITADRSHDSLVTPAHSTTPTATASGHTKHRPGGANGPAVVAGGGARPHAGSSGGAATPTPGPCDVVATESPSAEPPGAPLPEASIPALLPSPTASPCPAGSPSPSPTPSESSSATPSPSESTEPTASPS